MKKLLSEQVSIPLHLGKSQLFFSLLLLVSFFHPNQIDAQGCDCVTTGQCPAPIPNDGTLEIPFQVSGFTQNDLGECPLTSVCFTITHTWIGDLSASLSSPNGTEYILMADDGNDFGDCGVPQQNIDVCFIPGSGNPLTDNSPYPNGSSGPCPAGTCFLTGNFTLACGGVTAPVTGSPESPNCDLNDFNQPGAPVNGVWTLKVTDVCSQDSGTLDNFWLTFECGEIQVATYDIVSPTPLACPPDSIGGCQKVCENSTVIYEVEDVPADAEVTWDVSGAEGFEVNDNSVEVTWGDAGEGEVTANVEGGEENTNLPLQIFCGQIEQTTSASNGVEYAKVRINSIGGSPWTENGLHYLGYITDFQNGSTSGPFEITLPYWDIPQVSTGTYSIEVIDSLGNSETCEFEVSDIDDCFLTTYIHTLILPSFGNDGAIQVSTQGNSGLYSTNWYHNGTPLSTTTWSHYANNLPCGIITYEISDDFTECSDNIDIILACPPPPTCSPPTTQCVEILKSPASEFETTPAPTASGAIEICQGQEVFFENLSSDATDYIWDFGDTHLSTDDATSHVYDIPGTYTAALIARNDCFCTDTSFVTVEVQASAVPQIDCLGSVCEGDQVNYETNEDCDTFIWSVSGNGNIVEGGGPTDNFMTVEWLSGPEGFVTLQTEDCVANLTCEAPNILPIAILSDDTEIEGPNKVCDGEMAEYSIPDFLGAEINWAVGEGGTLESGQGTNRITVKWDAATANGEPQPVVVFFENCFLGCEGQDTLMVLIKNEFFAGGDIQFCQNESGQFFAQDALTNAPANCTWEVTDESGNSVWSGGSASQINIPFSFPAGNYAVRAEAVSSSAFCNEFYEIPIHIFGSPPPLDAINGQTQICPGETYTYSAVGLASSGVEWTIENGSDVSTLTGNPINVTWGENGPRKLTVTQTSTTGLPCVSEPSELEIEELPQIQIEGEDMVCEDGQASYSAPSFSQINYEWSVSPSDAGTIISGQGSPNLTVNWHTAGNATLSLTACDVEATFLVEILAKPEPQIPNFEVCEGQTLKVSSPIIYEEYSWVNIYYTVVSTEQTATLGFGNYTLLVTDEHGCTGIDLFSIHRNDLPDFTLDHPFGLGICPDGDVELFATTLSSGLDFEWTVNGVPSANNSASIPISEAGQYAVTATDQNGCTSSQGVLFPSCEDAGGECVNGACVDTLSSGPTGPVPPDSTSACEHIGELSFEIMPGADCLTHEYLNTSSNFDVNSLTWNFDDPGFGNSSTLTNPSHTFDEPGFYLVRLTGAVNSTEPGVNCPDSFAKEDTILAIANFVAGSACPGEPLEFHDWTEHMPFIDISEWAWDFGDPTSGTDNFSVLKNPSHSYSEPGTYSVNLTITLPDGCQSSRTKNIIVHPLPDVSFDPPTIACEDYAFPFSANSPDAVNWSWDFSDPMSGAANSSGNENTQHVYDAFGNFDVTLTVKNIFGCEASFTAPVSVLENTLTGTLSESQPSPICEGDSVTLTAASPSPVDFSWTTGAASQNITVYETGIYGVNMTDQNGCQFSPPSIPVDVLGGPNAILQAVVYNQYGQPGAIFQDSLVVCEGEEVNLEIVGQLGYAYQWSNGSGDSTIVFSEEKENLLEAGTYNFTVTVTDGTTGCSGTEDMSVVVVPGPEVEIYSIPAGSLCATTPVTLYVSSPQASLNYSWVTGETGENISVVGAGNYFTVATNSDGCTSKSNAIEILNAPGQNAVPLGCLTRCLPSEICLPDLPEVISFQWYLDGSPLPPPMGTQATPAFTQSGDYQLEMTDVNGCVSLSGILSLDLYQGTGDIMGEVFFDVNGNGIIDSGDTTVSGIDLYLFDGISPIDTATSDFSGGYVFGEIPSTAYTLILDTLGLPEYWSVYSASQNQELVGCDAFGQNDWLLFLSCPTIETVDTMSACPNESIIYQGIEIMAGESATFSYPLPMGCDSLFTVEVMELPHSVFIQNEAVCEGSFFQYQGTQIPAGESAIFPEINASGCMDTTIVSVETLPSSEESLTLHPCPGDSVIYSGVAIPAGGTEVFVFENHLGCDSIVTVNVEASPVQFSSLELEACPDETVEILGLSLSPGEVDTVVLSDQFGCDSFVFVSVSPLPAPDFGHETSEACFGKNDGTIQTSGMGGGSPPFLFSLDGQPFADQSFFENLEAGMHTLTLVNGEGCENEQVVEIPFIPPMSIFATDETLPCRDRVLIRPQVVSELPVFWEWKNGEGATLSTEPEIWTELPGTYFFTVENDCETIERSITVSPAHTGPESMIYMPNSFSPNNDGINDCYRGFVSPDFQLLEYELLIFDRWGNHLFETEDIEGCWDGTFRGEPMAPAVVVWYIKATAVDCNGELFDIFREGGIHIMR